MNDMQYIDLPLPKSKMWCIIKKQTLVRFLGGRQMKEYDELMVLAAQSELPSAFISSLLAFARSLQGRGQTQAPAADLRVIGSP